MHLTDEQFEDLLAGRAEAPEHLAQCSDCRQELEGRRALRRRLASAFAPLAAPQELADRIRRQIARPQTAEPHLRIAPRIVRLWPVALAAMVLIAAGVGLYFWGPPGRVAAAAELARIHQANLAPGEGFHAGSDPGELADWLSREAGTKMPAPRCCRCSSVKGGCMAHFAGDSVPTYALRTPKGEVSVVLLEQTPRELGLSLLGQRQGLTVYVAQHESCRIAATRVGDRTFCAVGELPHDDLAAVLNWALPQGATRPATMPGRCCPFCTEHGQHAH